MRETNAQGSTLNMTCETGSEARNPRQQCQCQGKLLAGLIWGIL